MLNARYDDEAGVVTRYTSVHLGLATQTPTLAAGILEGLYSFNGETLGGLTMPMTFTRGQPAKRVECWGQLLINSGKYVPVNNGEVRCR